MLLLSVTGRHLGCLPTRSTLAATADDHSCARWGEDAAHLSARGVGVAGRPAPLGCRRLYYDLYCDVKVGLSTFAWGYYESRSDWIASMGMSTYISNCVAV